jgi:hypothetical protein
MINIFQAKLSTWLVFFITICILAGFEGSAEPSIRVIHLNSSGWQL